MAKLIGKDARLYIAGYDISAMAAGVTPNRERDMHQYAVMDGVAGYHYFPGIGKDTLTLEGIFDDNYTTVLQNLRSATTGYQVIIPFGTSQGDDALAADAVRLKKLEYKTVVTDLNRVTAELVTDDRPFDECIMIQEAATKTADGESSSVDNSAETTDGAIAFMQYWGLGANDTLTLKIQESSDDGGDDSWADLISFTALDGSVLTYGSEKKTVTGTIERYLRAVWTFGGVSTYSCSFLIAVKRL
ncbi:MAG: hypothetical protein M0R74_14345 [Dehalococcoidia bacterium]|nr:hypothetical protein [Dehalococcoidia bacterium]